MRCFGTAVILGIIAAPLVGCDPGVHVSWQKQFDHPISPACVASALKSVSTTVEQGSHVSEGDRGFPQGTRVMQFGYSDASGEGYYNLDIAPLPGGKFGYWHGWSHLGTSIPTDQRARILPLLYRANRAVGVACRPSFDDVIPEEGKG